MKNWGEKYGMEVFLDNLPNEIAKSSRGFQENARSYRRRASLRLLEQNFPFRGSGYVCMAHHLDDDIETLLMKLLRGVHISNFSGVSVACAVLGPWRN